MDWPGGPQSVVQCVTIAVFYLFFGTRMDLLYNIAIVTFPYRSALYSYLLLVLPPGLLICGLIVTALLRFLVGPLQKIPTATWHGPGQPYLIPCRTTHSRLFPVKHSFSYYYLAVGIPVGFKGNVKGMISIDDRLTSSIWTKFPFADLFACSWFSIRASNYLQRGQEELSLRQRLDLYLQSEGLNPNDFPHAYLVTAPKFAGYSFNPVSFWYLYSDTQALSAMILEVNNTYDERRPYIVFRDPPPELGAPAEQATVEGYRAKDFYVSPFNSRKGHDSVLSSDPLGPEMNGIRGIDVKIGLHSSRGHPKLIARLVSEGPAVDPTALSLSSKLAFLMKWSWVGFTTVPKIVKEAIVLLYRRKLNMVDKPEPLIGTLGKRATSIEKTLEECFRQYLESVVHNSRTPLSLKYSASGLLCEAEMICTSHHNADLQAYEHLELRVLTPKFYSRFIQYNNSLDGISSELREHKTIWMNKPELLHVIFFHSRFARLGPNSVSFSNFLFSAFVMQLRRLPPKALIDSDLAERPQTVPSSYKNEGADVSSLESYLMMEPENGLNMPYKSAMIRQLIADRFFKGRVDWLERGILAARLGIALALASSLSQMRTLWSLTC